MAYIWINPVTASMYQPEVLDAFLQRYGYQRLETNTDWLTIVRNKYQAVLDETEKTVIDVRCPKIQSIVKERKNKEDFLVPKIPPILIHCGKESGEREDLKGEDKIITTPCQALADMGNDLKLEHTWFVPWNRFLEMLGAEPEGNLPTDSPIPPGFFSELGVEVISISGEEEIRNYFIKCKKGDERLVELLYCNEGCHNGDGIGKCKG